MEVVEDILVAKDDAHGGDEIEEHVEDGLGVHDHGSAKDAHGLLCWLGSSGLCAVYTYIYIFMRRRGELVCVLVYKWRE